MSYIPREVTSELTGVDSFASQKILPNAVTSRSMWWPHLSDFDTADLEQTASSIIWSIDASSFLKDEKVQQLLR